MRIAEPDRGQQIDNCRAYSRKRRLRDIAPKQAASPGLCYTAVTNSPFTRIAEATGTGMKK